MAVLEGGLIEGVVVDTTKQTLALYQQGELIACYQVSTAKNGTGQQEGSECTPLGRHRIAAKIGDEMPINSVFVGRVPTGEIYSKALALAHPTRDWILTRILWLEGLEEGVNKGDTADGICCDSYRRYIYIHGTPDSEPMGVPMSHGCVRMRHDDLVALYDQVAVGTLVLII